MALERQSSALPSPHPVYILRGHASPIHSVQFARHNSRLLTGDAHGWVVFWKVETKRALVVWKAHQGAILGTAEWRCDNLITHGRDNNLRIWQLRPSDETALSSVLPAEPTNDHRPKPWLLHTLPVNTLNFCAFSMCYLHPANKQDDIALPSSSNDPILIAVPARDDRKIDVYQFPDEKLRCIVPRPQSTDTGMVMAVKLVSHIASKNLLVVAGYEGGFTTVHKIPQNGNASALDLAQLVYLSQSHTQPILSLDVSPDAQLFFTSSADAIIAAHRIPEPQPDTIDGDGSFPIQEKTFGGASPQASLRGQALGIGQIEDAQETSHTPTSNQVPSISTQKDIVSVEPSDSSSEPLGFSKKSLPLSSTPSSLSFSETTIPSPKANPSKASGLSSLLSSADPKSKLSTPVPPPPPTLTLQPAYKTINTGHAGQQSLCVRSDGRLLVTGGWDKRIRVYSRKTLKEVAVLKWHNEGVYAVAFGEILTAADHLKPRQQEEDSQQPPPNQSHHLIKRETGGGGGGGLAKLQQQREEQMQLKHWIVAGAKDGKVSLWDVF